MFVFSRFCDYDFFFSKNTNQNKYNSALQGLSLAGSISSSVRVLSKLELLHLQQNRLQGSLPYELNQLVQLTALRLDGNLLTSTVDLSGLNMLKLL